MACFRGFGRERGRLIWERAGNGALRVFGGDPGFWRTMGIIGGLPALEFRFEFVGPGLVGSLVGLRMSGYIWARFTARL